MRGSRRSALLVSRVARRRAGAAGAAPAAPPLSAEVHGGGATPAGMSPARRGHCPRFRRIGCGEASGPRRGDEFGGGAASNEDRGTIWACDSAHYSQLLRRDELGPAVPVTQKGTSAIVAWPAAAGCILAAFPCPFACRQPTSAVWTRSMRAWI